MTPPESVRDQFGRCCTAVGRRARGRVPRSDITDARTNAGIVIARPVKLTGCTRALPAFWEIFDSNHCACGFLAPTHTTPTANICTRRSYLGATFPKNCDINMLDCNHFVIFNLCLYGNSLNQAPISSRLETVTSLAPTLPEGRRSRRLSQLKTLTRCAVLPRYYAPLSVCTQPYTAAFLPRRATPPVVSTQSSGRLDGSHVS